MKLPGWRGKCQKKRYVHIGSQKIQSQKRNSASRSPVIFFENANRYCLKREKVKKEKRTVNALIPGQKRKIFS